MGPQLVLQYYFKSEWTPTLYVNAFNTMQFSVISRTHKIQEN